MKTHVGAGASGVCVVLSRRSHWCEEKDRKSILMWRNDSQIQHKYLSDAMGL